jgi:hypothetical protein
VNGTTEQKSVKTEQKMKKNRTKKLNIKICEKRTKKVGRENEQKSVKTENQTKTKIINMI